MSGHVINTKFGRTDEAYILYMARDKGILSKGIITQVRIDIGYDGTGHPRIYYTMNNNAVFTPPGGMWEEFELGSESEAKELAAQYHKIRSEYHGARSDQFGG